MLNETTKKLYDEFSRQVYSEGSLTLREKELIAFACSVMIDCKHCMEYHLKKAMEAGVSADEINEAAAITMTVAAGKNRGIAQKVIAVTEEK